MDVEEKRDTVFGYCQALPGCEDCTLKESDGTCSILIPFATESELDEALAKINGEETEKPCNT